MFTFVQYRTNIAKESLEALLPIIPTKTELSAIMQFNYKYLQDRPDI